MNSSNLGDEVWATILEGYCNLPLYGYPIARTCHRFWGLVSRSLLGRPPQPNLVALASHNDLFAFVCEEWKVAEGPALHIAREEMEEIFQRDDVVALRNLSREFGALPGVSLVEAVYHSALECLRFLLRRPGVLNTSSASYRFLKLGLSIRASLLLSASLALPSLEIHDELKKAHHGQVVRTEQLAFAALAGPSRVCWLLGKTPEEVAASEHLPHLLTAAIVADDVGLFLRAGGVPDAVHLRKAAECGSMACLRCFAERVPLRHAHFSDLMRTTCKNEDAALFLVRTVIPAAELAMVIAAPKNASVWANSCPALQDEVLSRVETAPAGWHDAAMRATMPRFAERLIERGWFGALSPEELKNYNQKCWKSWACLARLYAASGQPWPEQLCGRLVKSGDAESIRAAYELGCVCSHVGAWPAIQARRPDLLSLVVRRQPKLSASCVSEILRADLSGMLEVALSAKCPLPKNFSVRLREHRAAKCQAAIEAWEHSALAHAASH